MYSQLFVHVTDNILVKRKCSTNPVYMSLSNVTVFLIFFPHISSYILDSENQNRSDFLQISLWEVLVLEAEKTIPTCFQIIFLNSSLSPKTSWFQKFKTLFVMKCAFHNISQKSWLRRSDTDEEIFPFL